MLRVHEDLLFDGASSHSARPGFRQVFDVNVQVYGRPVPLIAPDILCLWARLGTSTLLKKAEASRAKFHHGHSRHRFSRLREAEGLRIETNSFREVRHIDADAY